MVPPRGVCTKALAALPDSIGKEGIGVGAFACFAAHFDLASLALGADPKVAMIYGQIVV
ncbi:MAG: hypothetical protein K2P27_01740 [Lachnospiraceae bacterium]|nr:hypothetical protein [Lachnospiraceae bacterium]